MRLDHLTRRARVLTFRFAVKIAPANRRDVQQHSQRDQEYEKRVAGRRRTERRRLRHQCFFNAKSAGAGNHTSSRRCHAVLFPIFRQPE